MTQRQFISRPTASELPASAAVIVIGGGPAGTAALWAIERAAPGTPTVLVERAGQIAAGATNASLENFRTSWPTPGIAALTQRSLEVFLNADDHFGEGARSALGIRQGGYLWLALNEAGAAGFQADVAHLHRIGVDQVRYLDTNAVQTDFPWLGERIIAAKYDPAAGWLDSHALIYRMAQAAPSAKILLDMRNVAVLVDGAKVVGVATPNGNIAADHVVIAAGALSRAVGRTAGIDIPIIVRPRQSFTTPWRHAAFPPDAPTLIGAPPGPHVRPEAGESAVFGWEYHWTNKYLRTTGDPLRDYLTDPIYPTDALKDPRFPSITLLLLARQFGHRAGEGFRDARYLRRVDHRVGYYVYRDGTAAHLPLNGTDGTLLPYTSQRAIIDSWPGIDGLHLSVAHVGHGIMTAPAAGEIIAAKVLGQPLPDPRYADFGLDVPFVEHDSGELSG